MKLHVSIDELDGHPTYFETVTLMAFLAFRDLGIDTAVVEVGRGENHFDLQGKEQVERPGGLRALGAEGILYRKGRKR